LPYYLDPVSVRIKGKRDVPHAPIRKFLLELVARILDLLTGGLDVVHAHTNVPKALVGVFIAVVDRKAFVLLSAVVVGEFEDTFTVSPVVAGRSRMRAVVGCDLVQ